jgi:hypothetical protein
MPSAGQNIPSSTAGSLFRLFGFGDYIFALVLNPFFCAGGIS